MRTAIAPVTLEDAGGIAGTIVDATTGAPIAGVRVAAGRLEYSGRIFGGNGGPPDRTRGNFAVRGLAPGVYNVHLLSSPQGRKLTARIVKGVRVRASEDARADLRVVAGRRLHGKVVEAGNGQPIARLYVHCDYGSHPYSGAASSHLHGRARPVRVPRLARPGQRVLERGRVTSREHRLGRPGSRSACAQAGIRPEREATPRTTCAIECEVSVRVSAGDPEVNGRGRTLTGRVFDKHGSPLAGARVHYSNNKTINEVGSDRLGIFRMTGLPDGPVLLGLRRNDDFLEAISVPANAVEIDVIALNRPPGSDRTASPVIRRAHLASDPHRLRAETAGCG